MPPNLPPEGLSETRFGLRYYLPDFRVLIDVVDLRRKSGELWGEVTVACNLEGVRTPGPDGNRMLQGNFNFSSVTTRGNWARRLTVLTPAELAKTLEWANVLERVCMAVLDHERGGAIHGQEIEGKRAAPGGRPWAAWPILPHGDTATLFARGGAGKTSLVAMTAFGMALGHSIIPGIRIDRQYRTVILDWETNVDTAEDLWGLISETHHVPVPKGVWYEPMEAPLERSLPKIANVLDRHRADVVIIDSVMMSMASSADGSGDPADSITRVYQSLRRLGIWGLLIDHIAGGDYRSRRAAMKAYGSIYKLNLARHAIGLHIGQRADDTSQAYILCPKSNVGRDRWAMSGTNIRNDDEIRWSFSDPDYDLYDKLMHEADEEEIPESRLATPRSAHLYLDALDASEGGLTVAEIANDLGQSAGAVRAALNRLMADGLVGRGDTPLGRGAERRWIISQTGRAFLERSQRGVGD
jgi:DNA-binding MarR family transcriptional regulator